MKYTINDVNYLFSSIGKAIWNLQHLEYLMTTYNALAILQVRRENKILFTDEDAHHVLEKQRKLTLGSLISAAKEKNVMPQKLENRFDQFLIERNWLIHKCVLSDYLSLESKESKEKLFARINYFTEEAISLKMELFNQMEHWYSNKGYDLDQAYALSELILKKSQEKCPK